MPVVEQEGEQAVGVLDRSHGSEAHPEVSPVVDDRLGDLRLSDLGDTSHKTTASYTAVYLDLICSVNH